MYKVYMNQSDYDRIVKTMRLHGAREELVAAVAGTLQAGRISTKASRTYEWDRLLRGTVAQVASIQSNLRSHTGTVRLIRERLLKQARSARDAIGNASITGKTIEDFTVMEDDGVTPRNTKVWWTWIPKDQRDALQDELTAHYESSGGKPGKRTTLYKDSEYERIVDQGLRIWQERIDTLRAQYATPKTRGTMYPMSSTRKGAFMLGLARRIEREARQRAMLGEDIPRGLRTLLPSAIYARSLQARAVPDDHAGMDAMLDIKGFEDFYQP